MAKSRVKNRDGTEESGGGNYPRSFPLYVLGGRDVRLVVGRETVSKWWFEGSRVVVAGTLADWLVRDRELGEAGSEFCYHRGHSSTSPQLARQTIIPQTVFRLHN